MKPFNVNVILQNKKTIMQIIGLWPVKSPTILYSLRIVMSFCLTSLLTVFSLLKGLESFSNGNYGSGSYNFCIMIAGGHASFKVWFLQIQKPRFYNIINVLTDASVTTHKDCFDTYLQKRLTITSFIFKFQIIACTIAGFASVLCDFVFEYESLPSLFSCFEYQNKTELPVWLYICSWAFYALSTSVSGFIIGSYEGLMFTLLSLGVIQLQILRHQITHAINSFPSKLLSLEEISYYNLLVINKLSNLMQVLSRPVLSMLFGLPEYLLTLLSTFSYIKNIEHKFTYAYLIQLALTLAATGLIGLSFSEPTSGIDFSKLVVFFIADLSQLLVLCIPATEITVQSEMIRDACYISNWYRCDTRVRKTMYIIMERCKKPLYLTSGKFTKISLETFLTVLKTSMSYFTALRTLYYEEN